MGTALPIGNSSWSSAKRQYGSNMEIDFVSVTRGETVPNRSGANTGPPPGFLHRKNYLDTGLQRHLLDVVAKILLQAPLYQPVMPRSGKPFSVKMTNCGSLGWISDISGYRYVPNHPVSGNPWPPIPEEIHALWREFDCGPPPDACLINYYAPGARLGLHRDRDEEDLSAPILSISLGDECRFRIGGKRRNGRTWSTRISSGDVVRLAGESRLAFHGVDRIYAGTSGLLAGRGDLFPDGGRVNLTVRRVLSAHQNISDLRDR